MVNKNVKLYVHSIMLTMVPCMMHRHCLNCYNSRIIALAKNVKIDWPFCAKPGINMLWCSWLDWNWF